MAIGDLILAEVLQGCCLDRDFRQAQRLLTSLTVVDLGMGGRLIGVYCLISCPSAAMVVPAEELGAVGRDAHAVIEEAKANGVYVFAGGIDAAVPPVLVSADGAVADGGYPWAPTLDGGFAVLELPSRDQAVMWAARLVKACRCQQELRVFWLDQQS